MSLKEFEQKNRVIDRPSFADLPPRVIIHDVLVYHVFRKRDREKEKKPEFIHFGYFTRDRFRKIWFAFSSAYFQSKKKVILDYRRLVCLEIYRPLFSSISYINKLGPKMRSLERLNILMEFVEEEDQVDGVNPLQKIQDLFSKRDAFPRLKKFEVDAVELLHEKKQWIVCPTTNIFGRLKKLKIQTHDDYYHDYDHDNAVRLVVNQHNVQNIFEQLGENLVDLSLCTYRIWFAKPVVLSLPNLRKLDFGGNDFGANMIRFDEIQYEKMNFLKFCLSEEKAYRLFDEFYRRCRNLKVLGVFIAIPDVGEEGGGQEESKNWLKRLFSMVLNPEVNKLERLRKLVLTNFHGFPGRPDETIFGGEMLEDLQCFCCPDFSEELYDSKMYPMLKKFLYSFGKLPLPTRAWKLFENLEVLNIKGVNTRNTDVLIKLFELNETRKLRKLILENAGSVTDEVLSKIVMKNLRVLVIRGSPFSGLGVKKENLGRLEEVEVSKCTDFREEFLVLEFDGKVTVKIDLPYT